MEVCRLVRWGSSAHDREVVCTPRTSIHIRMKLLHVRLAQRRFLQLHVVVEVSEAYEVVQGDRARPKYQDKGPKVQLYSPVSLTHIRRSRSRTVRVIEYDRIWYTRRGTEMVTIPMRDLTHDSAHTAHR